MTDDKQRGRAFTAEVQSQHPKLHKGAMDEVGRSGLKAFDGYVLEEIERKLRGPKGAKEYRSMLDNCAKVDASFRAMRLLIAQAPWAFTPWSDDEADVELAEWYRGALMDDMSHSWPETLSEVLSMVIYGYSPLELVYKRRRGPTGNPRSNSRFTDGRIGWRKWALRAQETVDHWELDDEGGIQGLYQTAAPDYKMVFIPIEKLVLFRTEVTKNNPEGRSMLRGAWWDWFLARGITERAAIGISRNLTGMPVMRIPAEHMTNDANTAQGGVFAMAKDIIDTAQVHEQAGFVLPQAYDESGNALFNLELLASPGGTKAGDALAQLRHHDNNILMVLMMGFLTLGHEGVGTQALSENMLGFSAQGLNGIMDNIASTVNRHVVPRLGKLNGDDLTQLPELTHGSIEKDDVERFGRLLRDMALAGHTPFPDDGLARHVYEAADLPTDGLEDQRDDLAPETMRPSRPAADTSTAEPDAGETEDSAV